MTVDPKALRASLDQASATIDMLFEENTRLRDALRPFAKAYERARADYADVHPEWHLQAEAARKAELTWDDLIRAHVALTTYGPLEAPVPPPTLGYIGTRAITELNYSPTDHAYVCVADGVTFHGRTHQGPWMPVLPKPTPRAEQGA